PLHIPYLPTLRSSDLYFSKYHGISSGSDVIGATHLSNTYYFADVPTGSNFISYITILNPNSVAATVTASYYANGNTVQSQTITRSEEHTSELQSPDHL